MKLIKFLLSGTILLAMVLILLLITPIFLLIDGGTDVLTSIFEPTEFKKIIAARLRA